MLKRNITYKTFDDPPQTVTETFYFNLSEMDVVQMEMYKEEGMENFLRRIVETTDKRKLWDQFKEIILTSYGERSSDMKSFIKTPDIRQRFENSNAFNVLFVELMQDQKQLEQFIIAIMPEAVIEEAQKSNDLNNALAAAAAKATGVETSTPPIDIPTAPAAPAPTPELRLPEQPQPAP